MVRDNGDGTYTVTFQIRQGFSGLFGAYSDKTVTVDGSPATVDPTGPSCGSW